MPQHQDSAVVLPTENELRAARCFNSLAGSENLPTSEFQKFNWLPSIILDHLQRLASTLRGTERTEFLEQADTALREIVSTPEFSKLSDTKSSHRLTHKELLLFHVSQNIYASSQYENPGEFRAHFVSAVRNFLTLQGSDKKTSFHTLNEETKRACLGIFAFPEIPFATLARIFKVPATLDSIQALSFPDAADSNMRHEIVKSILSAHALGRSSSIAAISEFSQTIFADPPVAKHLSLFLSLIAQSHETLLKAVTKILQTPGWKSLSDTERGLFLEAYAHGEILGINASRNAMPELSKVIHGVAFANTLYDLWGMRKGDLTREAPEKQAQRMKKVLSTESNGIAQFFVEGWRDPEFLKSKPLQSFKELARENVSFQFDGVTWDAQVRKISVGAATIGLVIPQKFGYSDDQIALFLDALRRQPPNLTGLVKRIIFEPCSEVNFSGDMEALEGGSLRTRPSLFESKSDASLKIYLSLLHEETHLLARIGSDSWEQIVQQEGGRSSAYAHLVNRKEDLPEFGKLYFATLGTKMNDTLKQMFPKRFVEFQRMLKAANL